MMEILKNNFYLPLYAIAWVLSLVKFPKYFDSILKYFPILIGYTLCTEVLGMVIFNFEDVSLIFKEGYSHYTVLIYNLYDLFFFTFFFFVYYYSIPKKIFKQIIKYGGLLYIGILIVNASITSPLYYDLWYSYAFGGILLVIIILTYLKTVWGQPKKVLLADLLFWVSLGTLIFIIGFTPIIITQNNPSWLTKADHILVKYVHLALIVLMYSCYCIGFLLMRRMPEMTKIE